MMLTLALLALLWGAWANTLRADKKWRFEFYAFDFGFGALLAALLLAYTLGNSGSSSSFTFDDILTVASKRNMAAAVAAGTIFCLGNMMIMAGVTLAGMSTAIPAAAAMTILVTVVFLATGKATANPGLIYGSAGAAVAALAVIGMAQKAAAKATPVTKGLHPGWKSFILSCVGGLIGGFYFPVAESSRGGDIGVGSYAVVLFSAIGILVMTPLCNVFFLNLPVQGEPAPLTGYLKGSVKQHLLGLAGGALWAAGGVAFFAAMGASFTGAATMGGIHAAGFGGAVLAALCGLTIWGEPAGAPKAKGLLVGGAVLLAGAVAMLYLGA
ncbi:MAG: hypothetical protein HYX27_11920 [Acidobacteria bacterium]|nr:hypothetical protein [Acidobacteriota bacterium]